MSNVKQLLQGNSPIDFQVSTIGQLENFPKKDGGSYGAHEVKLTTRSNSEVYTVRMFPNQIGGMLPGSLVRGSLNDRGYPEWKLLPAGAASGQVPQANNSTQVRQERAMKKESDVLNFEQNAHDWKLGIAGLLQAFIAGGQDPDASKFKAVELARWVREEARRQAYADVQGQPSTDPSDY